MSTPSTIESTENPEYMHPHHHNDSSSTPFPAFDIAHLFNICSRKDNIMDKLLKNSSPFLFPCTIEYSLICAAILYIMWKNISEEHEHYKSQRKRRKITQKMIQNNVRQLGPDNWIRQIGDDKRSGQHYT